MAFKKFAMGTSVLMGENVCDQMVVQADLFGAKNILLVTDQGIVDAGIVDSVLKHLEAGKYKLTIFDKVQPDPSVKVVDKGAALAVEKQCDLIISVGGGSPIDAGKGIAVVAANGGSCTDYEGLDRYSKPPIPLFAVPTTCGTGSEVTFGAVLSNTDTNYKFILYGHNCAPRVAFLDPTLLLGIPSKVMVPTGMDALTHAVESYISKGATVQSKPMALEAIRMIQGSFRKAAADTGNIEAISQMLYAANIAGIAFACSRLGIVHAMALPLGAFFHVPHGIANSILLPHGLLYNLGHDNKGYCEMAAGMGIELDGLSEAEGARAFVDGVKQLAHEVGAPDKLSDVGVTADKITEMARDTMKSSHIPVNPRAISEEDVVELFHKAL
ncbi:MAG: iron-containing alcohol dehydrogenase [Planctomycetota bacterium]|nr:iron-containing alcohol dehydrogenase [Planctomycetota bacterium]